MLLSAPLHSLCAGGRAGGRAGEAEAPVACAEGPSSGWETSTPASNKGGARDVYTYAPSGLRCQVSEVFIMASLALTRLTSDL